MPRKPKKMYAFIIDPKKEERLKVRILKIVRQNRNGLRQSQINAKLGSQVRATYLRYFLDILEEDERIMKDNHDLWAPWNAPRNIAQRAWWEQCEREEEERRIAWESSPAGQAAGARKVAEERRAAQEAFNENLYDFLCANEEALFDLICRVYRAYEPKGIMHSMIRSVTSASGNFSSITLRRASDAAMSMLYRFLRFRIHSAWMSGDHFAWKRSDWPSHKRKFDRKPGTNTEASKTAI